MIDFAELKKAVGIEEVAKNFLNMGCEEKGGVSLRATCPSCKENNHRAAIVITPDKGVWYCFAGKKGGDLISLVAHAKGVTVKEAGEMLAEKYLKAKEAAEPPAKGPDTDTSAKGFPLAVCKATGIKFAKPLPDNYVPVTWKKPVSIPIRDEKGKVLGDIIVTEALLSPKWEGA